MAGGNEWGDDPTKWVIQKSAFIAGWMVFPPSDGEAWVYPSFGAAVDVVRCSLAAAGVGQPQ